MKLYQIYVTKADVDQANLGNWSDKFKAARDAMAFGEFTKQAHYSHVADIDTTSLDHAFEIGNIGPEGKIARHAPMHSVSVGDVLVTDYGVAFIVKPFGFEALDNWEVS